MGEANASARRSRRVSGKNHNELVFLPLGTVHSTVSLLSSTTTSDRLRDFSAPQISHDYLRVAAGYRGIPATGG